MRILFVIDGLPGGGAEKVVLTLAAQFLRDGDRVSLISLRDVCEYPLPEGLDYQVVADRCRGDLPSACRLPGAIRNRVAGIG